LEDGRGAGPADPLELAPRLAELPGVRRIHAWLRGGGDPEGLGSLGEARLGRLDRALFGAGLPPLPARPRSDGPGGPTGSVPPRLELPLEALQLSVAPALAKAGRELGTLLDEHLVPAARAVASGSGICAVAQDLDEFLRPELTRRLPGSALHFSACLGAWIEPRLAHRVSRPEVVPCLGPGRALALDSLARAQAALLRIGRVCRAASGEPEAGVTLAASWVILLRPWLAGGLAGLDPGLLLGGLPDHPAGFALAATLEVARAEVLEAAGSPRAATAWDLARKAADEALAMKARKSSLNLALRARVLAGLALGPEAGRLPQLGPAVAGLASPESGSAWSRALLAVALAEARMRGPPGHPALDFGPSERATLEAALARLVPYPGILGLSPSALAERRQALAR
jgi:hypothetical protein